MSLDLPEQLPLHLAALDAVRAELEAALDSDENWRALRHAGSQGEPALDRRDRDARLRKALEANPLYAAWRHLGEAIGALDAAASAANAAQVHDDLTRVSGITQAFATQLVDNGVTRFAKIAAWTSEDVAVAAEVLGVPVGEIERQRWIAQAAQLAIGSPVMPDGLPVAVAGNDLDEIDLPEDIRERIRSDSADIVRFEPPSGQPARPSLPPLGDAEAAAAAEQNIPDTLGGKRADIPSVEPIPATTHLEFAARLHKLEADMDEFGRTIEAPSAPHAEVPRPPESATVARTGGVAPRKPADLPALRLMREPPEAKVTFVTREPAASQEPSAADAGGGKLGGQPAPAAEGFVPPAAAPEEAEVTIVKPEDGKAAPVRRFLAALSGDQ